MRDGARMMCAVHLQVVRLHLADDLHFCRIIETPIHDHDNVLSSFTRAV